METYRANWSCDPRGSSSNETRHYPCDARRERRKGVDVTEFTVWFQSAAEPSQCVAQLDALHGTLE